MPVTASLCMRQLLASFALALSGCCGIPIGDEVFTVSGSVPPHVDSCDIFLRTQAGEEVPFTRRKVSGQFREQFPVTSCSATYQIVTVCEGMERNIVLVNDGRR
jgi:hypothetical protein